MTVGELIEILKRYPQEATFAMTYESVINHHLDREDIYLVTKPDEDSGAKPGMVLIGDEYKSLFGGQSL